jgi:hypothetical protein
MGSIAAGLGLGAVAVVVLGRGPIPASAGRQASLPPQPADAQAARAGDPGANAPPIDPAAIAALGGRPWEEPARQAGSLRAPVQTVVARVPDSPSDRAPGAPAPAPPERSARPEEARPVPIPAGRPAAGRPAAERPAAERPEPPPPPAVAKSAASGASVLKPTRVAEPAAALKAAREAAMGQERGAAHGGATDVQEVFKQHAGGVKLCYERALKQDETLARGRIMVRVSVADDGSVRRVELPSPHDQSKFGLCLTGQMRRWEFPASGKPYVAEMPLLLSGSD